VSVDAAARDGLLRGPARTTDGAGDTVLEVARSDLRQLALA
jgi:hypothetical protein